MDKKFVCDRCGLCCQNLNKNVNYSDLDDGTGTCIYYDKGSHLCKIYENRPEKCNVDAMYKYFSTVISYDEYLRMNYEACELLKKGV